MFEFLNQLSPVPSTILYRLVDVCKFGSSICWAKAKVSICADNSQIGHCNKSLHFYVIFITIKFPQYIIATFYSDLKKIPYPPRNLIVTQKEDQRLGFFGHAILNVTWSHPESELSNLLLSVRVSVKFLCTFYHSTVTLDRYAVPGLV